MFWYWGAVMKRKKTAQTLTTTENMTKRNHLAEALAEALEKTITRQKERQTTGQSRVDHARHRCNTLIHDFNQHPVVRAILHGVKTACTESSVS